MLQFLGENFVHCPYYVMTYETCITLTTVSTYLCLRVYYIRLYLFVGKTPFAGQIAKNVHKWLGQGAVCAVRFLGSSQVCEQITTALR